MLRKILNVIRNKYFIVTVAFLVWLIFFDQNNIISQMKLTRKLRQLQEQKRYYEREIEKNEKEANELKSDTLHLEKFAREKYLMKKENEDVYILDADRQDTLEVEQDTGHIEY